MKILMKMYILQCYKVGNTVGIALVNCSYIVGIVGTYIYT